jgi:serine/threonine-protein kinase
MSSAVRDRFELVGATLEGRFAVERVVAKGGFGIVYQGLHLALRKPVALKVLFTPDDLSAPERGLFFEGFTQEARTIASLDHPAIVRVFDFGIARPQRPGRPVDGPRMDRGTDSRRVSQGPSR